MVQLDELYDGEIISLKKGKNGLVTIKIQTNNKQGGQKNGFFRDFIGKLGGANRRSGHNLSGIPRHEIKEQDGRGTPSGENRESGSESGKEIRSGESGGIEA